MVQKMKHWRQLQGSTKERSSRLKSKIGKRIKSKSMSKRRTWILLWALLLGISTSVSADAPLADARRGTGTLNRLDLVEAEFVQVFPRAGGGTAFARSPGQDRAIVLIHGFNLAAISKESANKIFFHSWQKPGSKLVEVLAGHGDVYAFAYSQNVAVEEIAALRSMAENIHTMKKLGYGQIAVIGHSAGGLIARQFIEDQPDSGITKVIQVCAPNEGTDYAQWDRGGSNRQREFMQSLTKEARSKALQARAEKRIPESVEFVCIVGKGGEGSDGVVPMDSQWPADLRAQGIPAVFLDATHFTIMRSEGPAKRMAELLQANLPRWNSRQLAEVVKEKLEVKRDSK